MLGALIGAGASLIGGALGSSGAKSAARAQSAAQQAAINEQRRQFDITNQQQQPWVNSGTGALAKLNQLYGISQYQAPAQLPANLASYDAWAQGQQQQTTGNPVRDLLNRSRPPSYEDYTSAVDAYRGQGKMTPMTGVVGMEGPPGASGPDLSDFYNSPDYQFALQQGQQAIERRAAAGGGRFSGNLGTALAEHGQGLATQHLGNYTSRLLQLAGLGQGSATSLGQFGANMAGNVGNLMVGQGDARASGIAGSADAWGNAAGTLGGIAYDYFRNRPKVPSTGMTTAIFGQ
jgi:hypothetical protein